MSIMILHETDEHIVTLGLEKRKRSTVYTDLDHLAGIWSDQDAAEFAGVVADFDKVDEEMWK